MLSKLLEKLGLSSKKKGFTLIEVVIVLAIAGLIFVIVFLAVSQAQASRRDTQRKADANRLSAGVEQYASNNSGNVVSFANINSKVIGVYVTNFNDPSTGGTYNMTNNAPANLGDMQYKVGVNCNGSANANDFKIVVYLERGGATGYCVDSGQ